MQTILTTENAGGASAADDFASALDKAEELASKIEDATCVANFLEEKLQQCLGAGMENPNSPCYFYVSPIDKRMIQFAINDATTRSDTLDLMANDLVEALNSIQNQMEANATTKAVRPSTESGLELSIRSWRVAFTELVESGKGGEIPCDTPEAEAEEKALKQMAGYPCLTLGEVRRKASLFIDDDYLKEAPRSLQNAVMRSFSDVAIFDAQKMKQNGAGG